MAGVLLVKIGRDSSIEAINALQLTGGRLLGYFLEAHCETTGKA